MRILELSVENIGPFDRAHLELVGEPEVAAPVTLITGENGTGKTILLDAIRGMFGSGFCALERPIWRPGIPFVVEMTLRHEGEVRTITSRALQDDDSFALTPTDLLALPHHVGKGNAVTHFVVDFWSTAQASHRWEIRGFTRLSHRGYLIGSLQGVHENAEVTNLICYFDELRESRARADRQAGELLSEVAAKIVAASLGEGELSHVDLSTFMPFVKQRGRTVPLSHVSRGSAYLIQRMISLLGKMYSVHVLGGGDPAELCKTPGVLLIDDAASDLHPRWQRLFFQTILGVFPNLQIIATTRSPLLVAQVPNARVYTCRYDGNRCVVGEESGSRANGEVEESPVSRTFEAPQVFSEEISALILARKGAVERCDDGERQRIEKILHQKNPEYFSCFELEEPPKAAGGGAR